MFEAYSVAVRVSLINGVTSGLMNISRSFMKVHGDAEKLQRQLDSIKFRLVAGAALAGTGLFGLSLIEKTIPAAREYAHQIQQMNIAGMKQVEIAKAVSAAWGAAATVPTSTATQNLAAIRELRMVFGDTQHAIANMPVVQQLQAILQNVKGVSNAHDEAYTVAKALEMKGAVKTPGEFRIEADMMAKAIVASGGKVDARDFLSTFKYGRSATIGWDQAFAYTILPTLIQEMKNGAGTGGAGGPGNALMSVYDKVINGKIAQKDIPLWAQLGLIDPSKVVRTKTGSTKGLLPKAVVGWEMFQRNPYQWVQSVLMPAMRSHGITGQEQQQMFLSRLGGTRTAAFMLQQMGLQGWKFQRDVPLIQGAQGLSAFNQLVKKDPLMAQQALEAQWTNVKTRLGLAVLPMLIAGTIRLTNALTALSNWMAKHPDLTKGLVIGFAALSAAMAFGGVVLMLSAAFSAIGLAIPVLAAGFSAVGGAIAALAAVAAPIALPLILGAAAIAGVGIAIWQIVKHWDASKSIWANIKAEFVMFVTWVWDKVKWLLNKIPGVHIGDGTKPRPGAPHVPPPSAAGGTTDLGHSRPVGPGTGSNWLDGIGGRVAPVRKQPSSFHGAVYMDGQKVGHIVSGHQSDALDRSAAAVGSGVDSRMALIPVSMNYA